MNCYKCGLTIEWDPEFHTPFCPSCEPRETVAELLMRNMKESARKQEMIKELTQINEEMKGE